MVNSRAQVMSELVTYVTGFPKFVFIFDHFLEHRIGDVTQLESGRFFGLCAPIKDVRTAPATTVNETIEGL